MNRPRIFISSTFYDLKQIRADLSRFIEDLGYSPVMSELSSFPIDPSVDTITNCLRAVEQKADIMVLVVGSRYGSIIDKSRSITNLEYLRAKSLGLPIFVFLQDPMLSLVEQWKCAPSNDFSAMVDSPKLLEFVQQIRVEDRAWTFSFREAHDIEQALRTQLAYLFNDALVDRKRLRQTPVLPIDLSPRALRLLLEKPEMWEYRLFLAIYADRMAEYAHNRFDHKYALRGTETSTLEQPIALIQAVQGLLANLQQLIEDLKILINTAFPEAMGPRGMAADIKELSYVACRVADYYGAILSWSAKARSLRGPSEFDKALLLTASFPDQIIETLEGIGSRFERDLDSALEKLSSDPTANIQLDWTISFDLANHEEFAKEMDKLTKRHFSQ